MFQLRQKSTTLGLGVKALVLSHKISVGVIFISQYPNNPCLDSFQPLGLYSKNLQPIKVIIIVIKITSRFLEADLKQKVNDEGKLKYTLKRRGIVL